MAATTPRPIPTYWLRATEAASYARVQKRTLMQAHRFGHLRAHRVSNRVVFTRRDIDDWIRGGGLDAAAEAGDGPDRRAGGGGRDDGALRRERPAVLTTPTGRRAR